MQANITESVEADVNAIEILIRIADYTVIIFVKPIKYFLMTAMTEYLR